MEEAIKLLERFLDSPNLYQRTGDVKDINTLLVNRGELRSLLQKLEGGQDGNAADC